MNNIKDDILLFAKLCSFRLNQLICDFQSLGINM